MRAEPKPIRSGKLPDRLRAAREAADLTEAELGEKVDVGRVAVIQWENRRNKPSLAMVEHLAVALGVPAEYLAFGIAGRPKGRAAGARRLR